MAHAPEQDDAMREDANDGQTQDAIDTPGDASADGSPADDGTTDVEDAAASPAPAPSTADSQPQKPSHPPSASAPEQPSASRSNLAELSAQFRETAAEITEIAAQAGRLGIAIDAATALREGTTPEVLRKLVLQRASDASDARDVVAAAPLPILPKASESPIVAAAKRAAASPRG